ncbi:MAG TPA: hypothetical protein VGI46_08940, partial [Candidatus Acidoferrum sp.]
MGSDHDVYQDSSFGIPAIYMNDWPDRYIHTNFDTAANIDTTKLKRAAFIGAACGYFLAGSTKQEQVVTRYLPPVSMLAEGRTLRTRAQIHRCQSLNEGECARTMLAFGAYEMGVLNSYDHYAFIPRLERPSEDAQFRALYQALYGDFGGDTVPGTAESLLKFRRKSDPRGPLAVFGYDYFGEHAKAAG